jgi:hypothetical protein
MTKDKALTGAAGEYYVAFRLTAMEYAVGLTPHGTMAIDLIGANPRTGKSVTIQTKTATNAFKKPKKDKPYWYWRVPTSPPETHESFFYAFVDLKGGLPETPDVFIVPSSELHHLINGYYEGWCGIEESDEKNYKNRWDIIEKELNRSADGS